MKTFTPDQGMSVRRAAKQLVALSKRTRQTCVMQFNGVELLAMPTSDPCEIVQEWRRIQRDKNLKNREDKIEELSKKIMEDAVQTYNRISIALVALIFDGTPENATKTVQEIRSELDQQFGTPTVNSYITVWKRGLTESEEAVRLDPSTMQ